MSEAYKAARAIIFRPSEDAYKCGLDINKASLVGLEGAGLLAPSTAARIACGVAELSGVEYSGRWVDYLEFETKLQELVGDEASLIHLGRSRQDMFSTIGRAALRDGILEVTDALIEARGRLLAVAELRRDMVIPAYTHGVQAQPTTFGHYLLALCSALARATERLSEIYVRVNRSPLGAGALATSRFPLDRDLLADLLGFDGIVDNAYDANHISPTDSTIEAASAFAVIATQLTQFSQDLHLAHANPQPWLRIADGPLTGISSMMPQKRNPSVLETMREVAAFVIGRAQGLLIAGHNLHTGMPDLREDSIVGLPSREIAVLVRLFGDVIDALELSPQRALEECMRDYSTMTEVADVLHEAAGVPFRVGHNFASELANLGRHRGESPGDISFDAASALYRKLTGKAFPLTPNQYRDALDPVQFVRSRAGQGGPQPVEFERMLAGQQAQLREHIVVHGEYRARLVASANRLESSFRRLASAAPH